MSNVVNLYVRFSCMCIYCLYLRRRQKCLNHSAIHLTCLYIYIFILCYTCICHMLSTCMFAYHVCVLYVFLLYLSWRHGRTAPWPSCLSRLKNLIKKTKKNRIVTSVEPMSIQSKDPTHGVHYIGRMELPHGLVGCIIT